MLTINGVAKIDGVMTVAGDKSISHRALMLGSIAKGKTIITGFLQGEDCLNTVKCFRQLGVEINQRKDHIEVCGNGTKGLIESNDLLDVGNSGTTMRLMSGILAGQEFLSIVTGDNSIRSRPMDRITIPLKEMGAKIEGRANGILAPLVIRGGNLTGIDYTLPVASAQVKSAILLAGIYAEGTTIVREEYATRDHTERMLKAFGGNIESNNNLISVTKSELQGQEVKVPGDISSAAFFIVAAAAKPGSHLIIKEVGLNPTRTGIIDVLKAMGASITIDNIYSSGGEEIGDIIIEGSKLQGTNITKDMIPGLVDEIPVIAVAAALAEGKTIITGAEELRHKECDRINAVVTEMSKLGVNIKELEDGMEIEGPNEIVGGTVESYGDHRIAMAMAICGLFAKEHINIKNPKCIDISFPEFESQLKKVVK